MRLLPALLAVTLLPAACAAAVPECQLRVLRPVTDDLGNRWLPGKVLPVDIERTSVGAQFFCAHGGSCVPATADGVQAVRLLNCSIGDAIDGEDHRLVPAARLAGAATADAMQQRSRVEERLSDLGFSNASSGSLAQEAVDHPGSPTSRLVRRALAGSASALSRLRRNYP